MAARLVEVAAQRRQQTLLQVRKHWGTHVGLIAACTLLGLPAAPLAAWSHTALTPPSCHTTL